MPMSQLTRRAVLTTMGLLGFTGATGAVSAGAQQGGMNNGPEMIVLRAGPRGRAGGQGQGRSRQVGWFGLAPPRIRNWRNPVLRLRAGQQYELVGINADGREHELVIGDGAGEDIVETPSTEQRGATARVVFQADPRMSTYYCYYHSQAMRGRIEVMGQ